MKAILYILLYIGITLVYPKLLLAQGGFEQVVERSRDFRVMFYNCENYFDTINDPLLNDEEFTPDGSRFWDGYKYYRKSIYLSKAIIATGGWKPVDLIGLCEIENRTVLDKLCKQTPLYKNNYKVAHFESPDSRGIDVALLYLDENFKFISKHKINITQRCGFTRPTRDILYVKGVVNSEDTLHVFVNHWPSRWGGQLESEGNRVGVAAELRSVIDSLFTKDSLANIVIMGDMNDEPRNISLYKVLGADENKQSGLCNLMLSNEHSIRGTYKYQGNWASIDHIIVSENLLENESLYTTEYRSIGVLDAEFLLENDNRYMGVKPFRSYIGFSYNGGYSDHLPVFLDFYFNKSP